MLCLLVISWYFSLLFQLVNESYYFVYSVLYQSCNKNCTNILFNWVLFAFGSTKHLVQHLSNDDCLEDQWRSQKLWELRSRGVVFGVPLLSGDGSEEGLLTFWIRTVHTGACCVLLFLPRDAYATYRHIAVYARVCYLSQGHKAVFY